MFLPRLSPFGDTGGKTSFTTSAPRMGGGFLFRREALILCSRRNIPTWSFGREKSVCVDENCHFCLCGRASKLAASKKPGARGSKLVKIWSLHLGVQGVSYRCYFQDVSHFR